MFSLCPSHVTCSWYLATLLDSLSSLLFLLSSYFPWLFPTLPGFSFTSLTSSLSLSPLCPQLLYLTSLVQNPSNFLHIFLSPSIFPFCLLWFLHIQPPSLLTSLTIMSPPSSQSPTLTFFRFSLSLSFSLALSLFPARAAVCIIDEGSQGWV